MWGFLDDRLVEAAPEPADAFRVIGLSAACARTTADRVRAALINSGLVSEAPPVAVRLEPAVIAPQGHLDVAVALAALASMSRLGSRVGWIFATGRLGLDGTVWGPGLDECLPLDEIVSSCQTPLLGFELMFEGDES